jgi:DNA repair protein RecO (recombination protein O)
VRVASELFGLESASVLRGHGGIRGDLARIACAAYASEVARELVRDHEPHQDLFDLLIEYLALLDRAPARPAALRAFELGALRAVGLAPRLDACARCGGGFERATTAARFDPGQGGALCGACSSTASAGSPLLSGGAVEAMSRLQRGGLGVAGAVELLPATGRELREALGAFLAYHLGRTLAARRFLDEIGPVLEG